MEHATYPSLNGRVVLVTGGATGIGAALVDAFARNQAKVAFVDIDVAGAEGLLRRLAPATHPPMFLPCDLTDVASLRTVVETVAERLGPIGVLVNNAANDERHALDEVTPEYWDQALAVNLRHQFFAAQAVRPHMQRLGGGAIINVSSTAWMSPGPNLVAYATAKSAVIGLTRSLALELGEDDIRVNAIAPGAIMTERQMRLWHTEASADEMVARQYLHRRMVEQDVTGAVLFLASDDSRMITKQCLQVDAGLR
jgi:NAD(P)-dependent dehydrogenase (short-subunit alcohol dehydrogenase family)